MANSETKATRGIYNHPWLTWIVGVAYSRHHKLVAVLDASLSKFQMMFRAPTEWEEMTTLATVRLCIGETS